MSPGLSVAGPVDTSDLTHLPPVEIEELLKLVDLRWNYCIGHVDAGSRRLPQTSLAEMSGAHHT